MSERRKISPEVMFARLRRNILLAQLKVSLDEELKRPSSPAQKRLAEMKLPPMRSGYRHVTVGTKSSSTQQQNESL
ncbi:hypothetical protein [Arthrobacter sp. ZGTC412]|uniref:hypothetical protein n=1 Tax=Arthrobacter sp. ZGTC412 TaxID=2058900 RepID=UPI0011B0B179|nr:hypothetical protein [Arthrobacter sp. ZGTC412]